MTAPHFKFLNSINTGKDDDMVSESEYSAFMVNRGLSYFADSIFYANEMNLYHHLDRRLQYDFLRHAVRKRKRFSKWFKIEEDETLRSVEKYFNYNTAKAKDALKILTKEQIKDIKKSLEVGGV